MKQLVPEFARGSAESPVLFIPWQEQIDILPPKRNPRGLCLSTHIGFVDRDDYFRIGVVFTIQVRAEKRRLEQTIFRRRGVMRRTRKFERWDIPVESAVV